MIVINVEEYCHSCQDFTADVIAPAKLYISDSNNYILGDTIVQCKYRKRCAGIKRYLETQVKEGKDD